MADKYDPYREALVVEENTIWPPEVVDWEPAKRQRAEVQLHAKPQDAEQIEYVRVHTGFCRTITVTPADLQRVKP